MKRGRRHRFKNEVIQCLSRGRPCHGRGDTLLCLQARPLSLEFYTHPVVFLTECLILFILEVTFYDSKCWERLVSCVRGNG